MDIKEIGSRGLMFKFYDLEMPTNVIVIITEGYYYFIDTYLGSRFMKKIDDYLLENYGRKDYKIINTHYDFDHIWGNEYFKGHPIYSHYLCNRMIEKYGKLQIKENSAYIYENINLLKPNINFSDQIYFVEDEILLKFTPGHTEDSISVLDYRDRIIYAGDNVEYPHPYLQSEDLTVYLATLKYYLNLDFDYIVGGHTDIEDGKIIKDNMDFIRRKILFD